MKNYHSATPFEGRPLSRNLPILLLRVLHVLGVVALIAVLTGCAPSDRGLNQIIISDRGRAQSGDVGATVNRIDQSVEKAEAKIAKLSQNQKLALQNDKQVIMDQIKSFQMVTEVRNGVVEAYIDIKIQKVSGEDFVQKIGTYPMLSLLNDSDNQNCPTDTTDESELKRLCLSIDDENGSQVASFRAYCVNDLCSQAVVQLKVKAQAISNDIQVAESMVVFTGAVTQKVFFPSNLNPIISVDSLATGLETQIDLNLPLKISSTGLRSGNAVKSFDTAVFTIGSENSDAKGLTALEMGKAKPGSDMRPIGLSLGDEPLMVAFSSELVRVEVSENDLNRSAYSFVSNPNSEEVFQGKTQRVQKIEAILTSGARSTTTQNN